MENIVKGKRTKRQRIQYSPPPALMVADSSSGSSADQEASMSPTEEEEDMANCLILLAQGGGGVEVETKPDLEDKFRSKRIVDQSGGNFVYECKTCSRCFPSFQALGGHRASHKKPRLAAAVAAAEERKVEIGEDMLQISMNSSFSRSTNNSSMIKPRVHECSICGSEFNSGQALGGHMRRHRPLVVAENQEVVIKKERSLLELDLNLPAPSSDDDELQRPSPSPTFELPLLFSASASALVDCHY